MFLFLFSAVFIFQEGRGGVTSPIPEMTECFRLMFIFAALFLLAVFAAFLFAILAALVFLTVFAASLVAFAALFLAALLTVLAALFLGAASLVGAAFAVCSSACAVASALVLALVFTNLFGLGFCSGFSGLVVAARSHPENESGSDDSGQKNFFHRLMIFMGLPPVNNYFVLFFIIFYNGRLQCFFIGRVSFLVLRTWSALMTRKRVLRGSMTSSI
jgi:hypothetical protein